MVKQIAISICLLFIISIFQSSSFASLEYDPSLNFKTLTTKHFYIHYHDGLGAAAVKLAGIAEKVHKRLTKIVKWTPATRTHVALVDTVDLSNGYATWAPHNKIQIYMYRPDMHEVLNNEADWLELVFTHEYTHILNIDTVHGFTWFARSVAGRCCLLFPNAFSPVWATEGFAVYQESHKQPFGRNNSTYTDMVMRTEVLTNSLKGIDEASTFPRKWPRGNVPYLYGGLFVKFLEERQHKGAMSDYFIENADNVIPYSDFIYPLPFLFNKDAKDVFGKSFHSLWDEWQDYIRLKYRLQIKKIKEQNLTNMQLISNKQDDSNIPRWSPDGKSLYYIKKSPRTYTGLMKYNVHTKKNERLCRVHYPDSIAVAGDNTVYVSDLEYYKNYSIYSELFVYKSGYDQLSSKLRSKYIDLFKDGKRIIFVTFENNAYSIVVSNLDLSNKKYLIKNSSVQIGYTRLSPDNKKVVFSISENNGFKDLVLLDLTTSKTTRLTNDLAKDIQPTWHPDGSRILFSSDRTGVYNIYEYNLKTKKITRLTNVLGGVFNPDVSGDGKRIAVASYEKNGYAIRILNYPEKKYQSGSATASDLSPDFFVDKTEKTYSKQASTYAKDYSIFNTLFPGVHVPILLIGTDENSNTAVSMAGFLLSGNDVLNKHQYTVQATASQTEKQAAFYAGYIFAEFHPNFIFGFYDDTLILGTDDFPGYDEDDEDKEKKERTRERYATASIYTYFLSFDIQQSIMLSYFIGREINETYYPVSTDNPVERIERDEEITANISLTYSISSTRSYSYSISREDGRSLLLYGNYYHKKLGSDTSHYDALAVYSEYLPGLFDNNVLLLQLKGGFTVNAPDGDSLFKLGKLYNDIADRDYTLGLRGYTYDNITGDRMAAATMEYRLPLVQSDSGLFTFPFMFRDLWLNLFFDYGNVWSHEKLNLDNFRRSAGAELHARFSTGYDFDAVAHIGVARGFDKAGEDQVYFAVSTALIGLGGKAEKMIPKKNRYYQK